MKKKPERKNKKNQALGRELTEKQTLFCRAYVSNNFNATKAAIEAGYSPKTAFITASNTLKIIKVKEYINLLMKETTDKLDITKDKIIQEIAAIAFANLPDLVNVEDVVVQKGKKTETIKFVNIKNTADLPQGLKKAISVIKQGKDGIEVKLHGKLSALEMLGRWAGVFEKDNIQKTQNLVKFVTMSEKLKKKPD